jgi:RNA polymerase sigma-70 factor (ECF subfamily)
VNSTSISLLERVRAASDSPAWQRFVSLYAPLLQQWAVRAGLAEAGDVVQEVFVVLLRELPSFQYDSARANFRGWLKTITINKVRDQQRKKVAVTGGNEPALELVADSSFEKLFDEEFHQQVSQRALQIMQSDFQEHTWRACWETTVNNRPAREVAAELEMSEAAVYVAKSRVLKRLREELAGLLE